VTTENKTALVTISLSSLMMSQSKTQPSVTGQSPASISQPPKYEKMKYVKVKLFGGAIEAEYPTSFRDIRYVSNSMWGVSP